MAIKRRYNVMVEIDYFEVNEDGKENDDKWIDSSYFKAETDKEGKLYVQAFRPNLGIEPLNQQVHDMRVFLEESYTKLQEYQNNKKVLGEIDFDRPRSERIDQSNYKLSRYDIEQLKLKDEMEKK